MIEKEYNSSADRMPVVFVGHGTPMNAAQDNQWSRGFVTLRDYVPKPAAILAISAHWYVSGTYLTSHLQPPTLHDFGGFPQPLYELEYPAPGHAGLTESVRELLGKEHVQLSEDWGLDHGIWSVLRWMYPEADVPVVQLSINRNLNIVQHYEIGQSLAKLRDQNVLIFASGNIVHNLRDAITQMRFDTAVTPDWASRFDEAVKQAILAHDIEALLSIYPHTADAQRAHPTPEHWLPLIYAAGAAHEKDHIRFPTEGFDSGSLSMRNIIFG
ncbi:MAG: 4,5-DOPA dioxygenase extradiol [Gammaproteobacteria bacterium]|nr:4,5-DOPA dioxygenase extradiol [Gammaproteobacteria bacterium]